MPGKAQVSLDRYFAAFEAAVPVFGRGQVSSYILAGLGDTKEAILEVSRRLIAIGVYPFVVPFVPISGHAAREPSRAVVSLHARNPASRWRACCARAD